SGSGPTVPKRQKGESRAIVTATSRRKRPAIRRPGSKGRVITASGSWTRKPRVAITAISSHMKADRSAFDTVREPGTEETLTEIEALAARQLEAYNAADLDAFCACYHAEVRVLDGEEELLRGAEAFREQYRSKFAAGGFGATVEARMVVGRHCFDDERY